MRAAEGPTPGVVRGWQRVTQRTQAHRFLFDTVGTAAFALVVITTGLRIQAGGGQAPLAWLLAVIAYESELVRPGT